MVKEAQPSEWVSLSAAAQILGVHPATVRNWADRGDLPARRTPGGHRRFRRSDLQQWIEAHQPSSFAEVQTLTQKAMGEMRRSINDGRMVVMPWYASLDSHSQEVLRQSSLQILDVLERYLSGPPGAAELVDQARLMVQKYAEYLIGQGVTLVQVVEGCLLINDFLHESVLNIVELIALRAPEEYLSVMRRMQNFTNELLLSFVRAYQDSRE